MKIHPLSIFPILLVLTTAQVPAQEAPPVELAQANLDPAREIHIPDTLDEFLAIALEGDPEVRRVQAEADAALALLDGTRSRVTQELVAHYKMRLEALARIDKQRELMNIGEWTEPALAAAKRKIDEHLIRLQGIDRQLAIKLQAAQFGSTRTSWTQGIKWDISVPRTLTSPSSPASNLIPAPRPQYPDGVDAKLHNILERPTSIVFEEIEIRELLDYASDAYEINFNVDAALSANPITINVKTHNLRAALLAVTENVGNLCFVFRDYGLFATTPERAATMNAPTIPANIPLLVPAQTEVAAPQQ